MAVGKAGTVIERPRSKPQNAGSSHDDDNFDGRGETYDGDDEGIQQRDKAAREEGGSESRDEQSQ